MTASEVPAQSPPDDVRQLEEEIAATRERLGDAVEQLVAKLDVKSQARAQAARITSQVTAAAHRARGQAVVRSGKVRGQLAVTAAKTRDQAASAADGAKGPGRHAAEAGTRAISQRRFQLGAAAALLLAGLLAVLLRRKR